jgi:hypothetical protein
MPAIASTGAMLLSGHKKHQFEVGLDLPNLIRDRFANGENSRQVFGASDQAPGTVNCFYRTRQKRYCQGIGM